MCLAIPMRIEKICDDDIAVVSVNDATTRVCVSLVKSPKVGDFVIVHAGYAIERLDQKEADLRIELFNELGEMSKC